MERPLYVFVHVPKTAGSTVLKHLRKNLGDGCVLEFSPKLLGLRESANSSQYEVAVKEYLRGMNKKERENLSVVYGHCLPSNLDRLVGRAVYRFTFLRDPVSRSISLYNYYRGLYENGINDIDERWHLEDILINNGSIPSFKEWFVSKYLKKTSDYSLHTQAEYFRKFGYLRSTKYYEALARFDFVGITEHFEDDAYYLYDLLGVTRLFSDQNKSRKYFVPTKLDRVKLAAALIDDYRLYRAARVVNRRFRKQNMGYASGVRRMREKRKYVLFNQLAYDLPDTLRSFKANLVD
jgi:hypothetical protein